MLSQKNDGDDDDDDNDEKKTAAKYNTRGRINDEAVQAFGCSCARGGRVDVEGEGGRVCSTELHSEQARGPRAAGVCVHHGRGENEEEEEEEPLESSPVLTHSQQYGVFLYVYIRHNTANTRFRFSGFDICFPGSISIHDLVETRERGRGEAEGAI